MIKARKHLNSVPLCPHGSYSDREAVERGLPPSDVIDFSASCNPLGPAPGVLAALEGIDPSRYPDDESIELKDALARSIGVEPECLVVGNGSVELMWLLAMAFLDPSDSVLVVGPTFGEYARACRIAGAEVEEYRAHEADNFNPDLDEIVRRLCCNHPKLAFLCNPNNPTGQLLGADQIEKLLEGCLDTLLVVDEAYLPFSDVQPDLRPLLTSGRLLLLRSMTKDYGLAGLRLGYAVSSPEIIGWIHRVKPPWNVNAAAQRAGLAALLDTAHLEKAREVIAESRSFLMEQLSALGLSAVPSAANFLLVRVGDGSSFRSRLLARGICVRDCASFGLPAYIRIGIRTLPECRKLVEAVQGVLASE
ncbi:MAG: pyridoxal phosphate-dependent aminotransferase [Chloroflexota bacterium]|jgi:histidinol-phosphate aminotransferase